MDLTKRTIEEVLEHHLYHVQHCNLEEALLDYTDESVIINPGGVVVGLKQIAAFFKESMETCLPADSVYETQRKEIYGTMAFTIFTAESRFCSLTFGSDTYIIKDGKIMQQTFAGVILPK